jgi:hypothetical protein
MYWNARLADRCKMALLQEIYGSFLNGKSSVFFEVGMCDVEFKEIADYLLQNKYIKEVPIASDIGKMYKITDLGIGAIYFGFDNAALIFTEG